MFYQLPNGKVIEISTEQYFDMSDEELDYLVAYNYGEVIENPWFGSILSKHDRNHDNDTSDTPSDLPDIPQNEKLLDLDIDMEEED